MILLIPVFFSAIGCAQLPEVQNPGFDGPDGWAIPKSVSVIDGALTFQPTDGETLVRQEFTDPGARPMIVSARIRAAELVIDADHDPKDYARLYVHVLYRDQPYSTASHFYTDVRPGTYDWRTIAVEVRPRQDLDPSEMWVSMASRFREGEFFTDDVAIDSVSPYSGADSGAWTRAGEAVVLSDLSACAPQDALSLKREPGHWKILDYATAKFDGKCIAALPNTGAPAVTLPLDLAGWHAVYLGLGSHPGGSIAKVKLTGDAAFQMRAHQSGHIQEVFLKCADLTGQGLQLAQQSAGASHAAVVMYAKLVPLTAEEAAQVQADAKQRETKRLIATIDGFSFLHERAPTTREELLEEFEHYRGTDFGTIWWCVTGADQVNYASELGTIDGAETLDFPREGDERYTRSVETLIRKGIDITKVAVEAAHSMDIEIHVGLRPAAWQGSPPYEEYFTSRFYRDHPEWRCMDKDGTPVLRMSFAVPEVREHLLGIFREVLSADPDGLNVLYNRGMPLILWEDAFCELFRERYGEDAKAVDDDDPRIYELRREIMTEFMQSIRDLLDARDTKRVKLSAMVLATEQDNLKFGLDIERWVSEGLLDSIGVYRAASHASADAADMEFFTRITEGTGVPVTPCLVAWALPKSEQMVDQALAWYDSGAEGVLFWDPSGKPRDAKLWPIISRMGHLDELRLRADMGEPKPVTMRLTRYGEYIYGRWNAMAGF